ncbi:MAG: aquaporin [Fimbriimonadaceae bacterium]|nr:aquaporin [Fimbriimonadaceae bacterium]
MKARAYVAEFIGTFALLFVIFNIAHSLERNGPMQLLCIALGVGLTIMVMGTSFGPISGGHFNPCVTFGMMIAKKIDFATGILYWIVQCAGGIAAVFLSAFILGQDGEIIRLGITVSRAITVSPVGAMIAEAIASFLFVTVIFMTAVDKRAPANGALFLGFTLTLGILAIGPVSGGAINPAVGLALSVGSNQWGNVVSWAAGPMIGAALAAVLYTMVWSKEELATTAE